MAEQIASLQIAIDSSQTIGASEALRRLEAAANAATASAAGLSAAHAQAVSGAAQMASAVNAAGAGANRMAVAVNAASAGANRMAAAVNAATASATRMAAAANAVTAGTGHTAAAAAAAAASMAQLTAAANAAVTSINHMSTAAAAATVGHGRMAAATNAATASTKQLQQQITNLGFQLNDIVSGILMGQSPFMILAQQGGQVYQALNGPGGVSAGLKAVVDKVISLLTPANLAGAALVGAATLAFTAWNRFDNLQKEVLRTVQGFGRIVGLNAQQFEDLAQRSAKAGDISVARATELSNALARTGNVDAGNILRISTVFKDLAATFSGGDLNKGIDDVVRLFGSGAAGLNEINKGLTHLHGPQLTAFEDALKQNRIQDATRIIIEALPGKMVSFQETTGRATGAWDKLKNVISDADLALGRAIDKSPGLAAAASRAATPNFAGAFGGAEPNLAPVAAPAAVPQVQDPPVPRFFAQREDLAAITTQVKELGAANGAANLSMHEMVKTLESASQDIDQQTDQYRSAISVQNAWNTIKRQGTAADRDAAVQARNFSEVLSIANHVVQAQSDAQGNRLKAEDLSRMAGDVAIKQTRARVLSEEAEAAGLQSVEQNRRAAITTLQASNERQLASQQVIERWRTSQEKANSALGDSIDVNAKVGSMIFATDNARSVELAGLNAEKEMLQTLGPTWKNYAEALEFVRLRKKQAVEDAADKQLRSQFNEIKSAGVSAFSSIATAIASGTSAMDAMTAGAKQLGSALTSGGINQIAQGNLIGGGVEAAVGLGLTFFGANQEKKKADRQKKLADAKTQAEEAARKADEINQAISTYLQRITAAAFAGQADTLQNRLAQFDARAQQERLDAMAKGGAAINLLEQALGMERANIVTDWNKKIVDDQVKSAEDAQTKIDAILQRQQSAQDRIFAAGIDTNTFAGKVAALERQFQREREDEIKAGGEAMTDLLAAQDAERLKLLKDNSEEWLRNQKAAFDDAKNFLTGELKSISSFLSGLLIGGQSPLAPLGKLTAAQSQFSTQLALAQSGNRDALSGITGNASALLEASRGYYGSTSGYQATFAQVQSQLGALPSQVSPEQFIVNAINKQTDDLSQVFDSIDVNQDGVISATEANGTFLQSIFNELDTNGDGMLQKSELIRLNTGNTATSSAMIEGYTNSNNTLTGATNALSASIYGVQATMSSQLDTQISQLSTAVTQLILMTKVVWNTAQLVTYTTNGFGSPQYARGGYVDGLGTDTSDSNTARLSRGEFVMRASAVREHGRGFFDRLNSGGSPIIAGGSPELLAEVKALRAEVARLTAVTAAGAEHVREGVDGVAARQADTAREVKLQRSRI